MFPAAEPTAPCMPDAARQRIEIGSHQSAYGVNANHGAGKRGDRAHARTGDAMSTYTRACQ